SGGRPLAAPMAGGVPPGAVQPPSVLRSVVAVGSEAAAPTWSGAPATRLAVPPDEQIRPAPRVPSSAPLARSTGAHVGVVQAAPGASAQQPTVAAPALSVEIALVQQAARALASGDAAVALSLLDTYDRQCPHGALADEAGALRVQALARSGRAPEARALAQTLLDAHPHGVLAARLKGVLDGPPDAESR